MLIDFKTCTPGQIYAYMTQTLVPRPIAWILSEHENGRLNLAPFSYFNAVSSDPPLLMVSVGKKPDGTWKDTRVNIEQRGQFVVHIPRRDQAEPMNASSATLAPGESEVERLGLATVPFEGFPLPRLAECAVAYGCTCWEIQEIGRTPQSLIFGQIQQLYLDDAFLTRDARGRILVDARRLDPLGRLGRTQYCTQGTILSIPRPK